MLSHRLQLIKYDQALLPKYFEYISLKLDELEFRYQQIQKMGSKILELFFQDSILPNNLLFLIHPNLLGLENNNSFIISMAQLYCQV